MDPVLQIDPERCVLVMGPQLAAAALSLSEGVPAALSYAMLIDIGVQKMLEVEARKSVEERSRKHSLLVNAYELEPAFAACKVVESLREHGVYQQWLNNLFGSLLSLPTQKRVGGLVDRLLSLQERGALLVYTYYDTILDVALKTSPIFLGDKEAVRGWASYQKIGLLHVHGVYSQPDSVCCDCVNYKKLVGEAPGGHILKEVCRNRSVIFIGFDGEFYDPFISKFARTFLCPSHPPPLLLSSLAAKLPSLDTFLMLKVSQLANLDQIFLLSSPMSQLGAKDSIENKISTTLLYMNKTSCLDAAERVKVTSGINVHQLTMRHEHLYHHLLLYLDQEGLRELWKILFPQVAPQDTGTSSGFHSGLLGVMMDNTVVWLKRTAAIGTSISSLPSAMETSQGLHDHAPLTTPHHSSRTAPPTSLTTNVSVISSMWTPIVSPSISKSTPSSASTRPTLPSPLISSTSRKTLGGMATKGIGDPTQMALLSPFVPHQHTQIRRVQSERDRLTHQDRLTKQALKKNGVLIHAESAPDFVYTSEGVVSAYSSDCTVYRPNKPLFNYPSLRSKEQSSQPSKDSGSQMEVKIEYVDQLKCDTSPPPVSSMSHDHRMSKPISNMKGFIEEKQKFISEAQSWSKQVDSEIAKKIKVVVTSSSLGGLKPSHLPSQPSLSSKFSQEEQEKFLRQHFEQIRQQQQQQTNIPSSSLALSVSLGKLPLSTLSVSTAHPSHTHSPHPSPKLSPLQLPHAGRVPSPQKSPINPFQTSAAVASMFPFLTQATNPTNFLCNPSLSQYPAAAAAMFNPVYQAALQQFLASQVKGKQMLMDKVPLVLPDGTITFVSTNCSSQGGSDNTSSKWEEPIKSLDTPRTHKRIYSPDIDGRSDVRGSPPKRRRSCSLPDITQLSQVSVQRTNGGIEEEEEDNQQRMGGAISRRNAVVSDGSHTRQLAPPTMIHIPQDVKINDPMLGFPTPPQSSPLIGKFTLSPIVLSTPTFHAHQPMTPMTPNQESLNTEELRELVEASGLHTTLPPSPEGSNLPPFPAGRGPIQLWQFLLDLLLSPDKQHMIHWTGNGYEFRILQPEEIAKLWGARKNKPRMNYDKLSRGLRYYYSKGIMDKVQGKKLTFKYTCDVQSYVRSRNSQSHGSSTPRSGGEYQRRSGSSTPVAVGRSEEMQGEEQQMEEMDVPSAGDRSFSSDLDLTTHQKVTEGLSGFMSGVQGFGESPPRIGRRPENLSERELCSEAT